MMWKNRGCDGLEFSSAICVVFKHRIGTRIYQRTHFLAVVIGQNSAWKNVSHELNGIG